MNWTNGILDEKDKKNEKQLVNVLVLIESTAILNPISFRLFYLSEPIND